MRKLWSIALLLSVALAAPMVPSAAQPVAYADDDDDDRRGPRGSRRDAERAQREAERAQREAEQARREAERAFERAQREARGDWRETVRYRWDNTPDWVQRNYSLPGYTSQPLSVQVVLPQALAPTLPPVHFTNNVQARVLPALVQVVPAEAWPQAPLQLYQLQPNLFVVAHPALFWGPDDPWGAQNAAAQLAQFTPGWQPMAFNGPFGEGTYLVLQIQ